jgi:GNAT superfamily N-acetyltransferase
VTRVYELPAERLSVARPVFADAWFDRAYIDSVFEGRQPGRLFVDDPDQPAAAIMFRTFGYYVAGDTGNVALRGFIRDAPPEPGVFQSLYGYVPDGEEWRQALLDDHGDLLEVIPRHGFRWYPTDEARSVVDGWRDRLPGDARLVEIDLELARRIDQEMKQYIKIYWLSHEAYAEGGFGYCLMFGNTIASVAYAISISSTEANIDVETAAPFRRQGLSMLCSSAFIERCRALGVTPTWDADGNNPASQTLARKLGFQEYPVLASQLSPPRGTSLLGREGVWEHSGEGTWTCR